MGAYIPKAAKYKGSLHESLKEQLRGIELLTSSSRISKLHSQIMNTT